MRGARAVLAAVLTLALVGALGALSRVPLEGEHAGAAALRLTWRVRAEEVGECLRPTAEELAELPVHMRNPEGCVGSIPPFRLTAEVDGATRADVLVEAAGARGDRPLYVYREILLEPGTHQVRVRFAPEDGAARSRAAGNGSASEGAQGAEPGRAPGAEPGDAQVGAGFLEFEGAVRLAPGQILLLTRAQADGALEVRAPAR